jgi:hypothetical protein
MVFARSRGQIYESWNLLEGKELLNNRRGIACSAGINETYNINKQKGVRHTHKK